MKILATLAVLTLILTAMGAWCFLSGRSGKMVEAMREFRKGAERPGAAQLRTLPSCGVAGVFDTREFWASSPELQARFPNVETLPPALVLFGVRKHVEPPSTEEIAQVYADAVEDTEGFVVVVMRNRIGEKVFEADSFMRPNESGDEPTERSLQ